MGRKPRNNYVEAALEVFDELGVDTLRTRDLIKAAIERGLVSTDIKWVKNHMSRKIRESELFDTSQRGHVKLQLTPDFIPTEGVEDPEGSGTEVEEVEIDEAVTPTTPYGEPTASYDEPDTPYEVRRLTEEEVEEEEVEETSGDGWNSF